MRTTLLLFMVGCASKTGATDPMVPADVVYEAGGTDEAWLSFEESTLVIDDARAPSLALPAGATLDFATAPTFSWDGGDVMATRSGEQSFLAELVESFSLMSVARAHLPPVTGDFYRLVMTTDTGSQLRVLTGDPSTTPSSDAWSRFANGATRFSLQIEGANFQEGRIEEGPFVRAMPYTFTPTSQQ